MASQQEEVTLLHDLAQKIVAAAVVPDDVGLIVITFNRKPETMMAIGATVVPDLAMEIIDHCAHSGVALISIEGHPVPAGTPMPGKGPKQ